MRYNKLGSTGFVSELCLETMTFGGTGPFAAMGNVGQADADAMLDRVFQAGVNIVDTADTYSGGDGTRRNALPFAPVDMPRAYDVIDALSALARQKRASVAHLAIAWLLRPSRVTSVIVGARRIGQLNDNLGAVDVALTAEDVRTLDRVSTLAAQYPGWMLDRRGQGRAAQLAQARTARVS